ncbi:MAG: hypothetical protein VXZ58_08565 [Actinomycetota bacterium]|nr:hypothetical protein [Actinomycetota bacterium]
MTKKVSSYDLWSGWRDFNQTGQDQSEGTTSVLSENASGTSSQALAKEVEEADIMSATNDLQALYFALQQLGDPQVAMGAMAGMAGGTAAGAALVAAIDKLQRAFEKPEVKHAIEKKGSSIVAETGQLAQSTRKRLRKLPYKDMSAPGTEGNPVDSLDSEKEVLELYNLLIRMGVDRIEAEDMVRQVLNMNEGDRSIADVDRLIEACQACSSCGSSLEKDTDSVPGMGRMLDYGESMSDAHEGQYARDQLTMINYLSGLLANMIHDDDDLPEWVQMYITQSELLIAQTFKYMAPHIQRANTEVAKDSAHDMSPHNVMVVKQESAPAPMKSRAGASVLKAVKASRRSGGFENVSLSDIFED